MDKAYALLNVKDAREDERGLTIKGMASTPTPDRVQDVMEPMGARFAVPMPLLWHHEKDKAVGNVTFAKPTREGIPFEAFLPYIKEAGRLKERVDEAIHSIKYRLVGAVSIGFKGREVEPIKGTNGYRFKIWDWLELSLVTIPANSEATITAVKSLDSSRSALLGKSSSVLDLFPSAVAAKPAFQKESSMPSLTETLSAAEKKRDDLAANHKVALDAVLTSGKTFDSDEQSEQTKTLDEIEKLDEYIDSLKRSDAVLQKAKPVQVKSDNGDVSRPFITVTPNKEKGIAFAQALRCLYKSGGVQYIARQIAEKEYRDDPRVAMVFKADVPAGAVTVDNWGQDFVNTDGGPFQEFLEFMRPLTIVGRLTGATRVEFLKPIGVQTGGGAGYWVGEGIAKPMTSIAAAITRLPPTKVANIIAVTEEWLKYASANNDQRIRDSMAGALQERLDTDFVDPAVTVSGVRPASITNGAATQAATGTGDHADIITDFKFMMSTISTEGIRRAPVLITDSTTALALSMMINTFGQRIFPDMSMTGGTFLAGVPAIVSDNVVHASAGGTAILVNAPEILIADEGGFDIALSRDATLQMTDTNPNTDMDSVTPNPASATGLVSMFQTNSVAFRAERAIGWLRARTTAVAYVTAVNWGAA